MPYPAGSEWRKWDLHIHSPLSALNNQFRPLQNGDPDWEAYLSKLETLTGVAVIGITDYFSIDGYRKVREFHSGGRLQNFGSIFPNIEFRLNRVVGANARRLNYHVIFSDQVTPDEIDEHFLQELKFCYEGDTQREELHLSVKKANLELLGHRLKEEHAAFNDGRSDYEIGCMTATVDPSIIKSVLSNKGKIFKDRYLIFLPEENLSLLSWNGQDHQTRKALLQGADGILSANPATISWSRGEGDLDVSQFCKEFKTLKPCVHGSDAHEIDKIGVPDGDRFCWIKANPTFEGLRQLLFEPRERVYIGEAPPQLKNDYQLIDTISIDHAPDWFSAAESPLNQGLIAIIGPRGSGKSALAELVAFAGGADFFREPKLKDISDSFLAKASKRSAANPTPITGARVTIHWKDGQADEAIINEELSHGKIEEKVKYLPQKFVERLCAPEHNRQLEEEIERVIFQRIDTTDQMDASNFQDLRHVATASVVFKRTKLQQLIRTLNQNIADGGARIASKASKEDELKRKREELALLQQKMPQIPQANASELQELEKLIADRQVLEKQIIAAQEQIATVDVIQTKVNAFVQDVIAFNVEIQQLLRSVGLEEHAEKFRFPTPAEPSSLLTARKTDLLETARSLRHGSSENAEAPSLEKLDARVAEIKKQSQLTEAKRKEHDKFQKDRKLLEDSISALEKEIKEITEVIVPRNKQDNDTRLERYLDGFELLKEEQAILERLYEPLRSALSSSNDTAKKLAFISKPTFNIAHHASFGLDLLDKRKALYSEPEDLEKALKLFFEEATGSNFDRDVTKAAVLKLRESFLVQGDKKMRIEDQLKEKRTSKDFADWFYNTEDFSVTYSMKFDGKDLHLLSPGEKGVVLLLLYLEAENQDNRPLIIDQPDDNLDNVSVFPNLTEYFRSRKKTRQIIVITHNPNLVVNTDAEQIFVARFDGSKSPKIEYKCGGLEDTHAGPDAGIREEVCRVLEGGALAFQKRELRYSLP